MTNEIKQDFWICSSPGDTEKVQGFKENPGDESYLSLDTKNFNKKSRSQTKSNFMPHSIMFPGVNDF